MIPRRECVLWLLVFLGFAVFCLVAETPAATLPHAAVCRVSNQVGNCKSIGSGTLVARDDTSGTVITAKHLFSDGLGTVEVRFEAPVGANAHDEAKHSGAGRWPPRGLRNGRQSTLGIGAQPVQIRPGSFRYAGKLIAVSRQWDLAAVRIARPDAAPAPLAATWPRAGETVHWTGYGPGGKYGGGTGKATGYVRVGGADGNETLQLTGHARQGDSGGPVFNERGELIAVLWGTDGRTICGTYGGRVFKFLQACCPGGVCPPKRRQSRPLVPVAKAPRAPAPVPRAPRPEAPEAPPFNVGTSPPSVTIKPPALKPPPAVATVPAVSGDLARMSKEIAALRAAIAQLKTRGQTAPLDYDKIAAAIVGKLPPLYVRKINTATGEETVEEVRLGEGLTFTMTPHGTDDTGAN